MTHRFSIRIDRLETAVASPGASTLAIISSVPMDDERHPEAVVQSWVASGAARLERGGRCVWYDGGDGSDLTIEEWERRYAPTSLQ